MILTVHLFASYADAFGRPQVDFHVAPGATVGELVDRMRAPRGRAGSGLEGEGTTGLPDRPLVAVNHEYATYDRVLEAGDEIALIPPVAGG
jgi:molybdopterin converting factor small subunit